MMRLAVAIGHWRGLILIGCAAVLAACSTVPDVEPSCSCTVNDGTVCCSCCVGGL